MSSQSALARTFTLTGRPVEASIGVGSKGASGGSLRILPSKPDKIRVDGRTALVTGAGTIGSLGHAAAKEMAAHGLSRLIIAARSVTKAEAARQDIVQGHSGVDVEVWELDYESWPSIEAFSRQAAQLDRLDIVVLSAGVKFLEYKRSGTGHEAHVQVNHLVLTIPLLALRRTIVTSEVHFWTKFEEHKAPNILDRMDDPESFKHNSMDRYNAGKLLNLLWLRELNARTDGSVIINGVHLGLCASSLHRSHSGVAAFNKVFAWSSQEGGNTLADAALQHTERGAYISEQVKKQPSPFVLSSDGKSTQKKLWRETLEIFESVFPDMKLKEGLAGDK